MIDWKKQVDEWTRRVDYFGPIRAVFNYVHDNEAAWAEVTQLQAAAILPLFAASLDGTEQVLLDFGCGWGRWTDGLAEMIHGTAIGVDPTRPILEEARKRWESDFRYYSDGHIPVDDASVDVIWCCMVLSTVLTDEMLTATLAEFDRVLKPGGLMFLIDNTDGSDHRPVVSRWSISRTIKEYQTAFAPFVALTHVGDYYDDGQRNSILTGRKA